MLKKSETNHLYNYHNPDDILLTINSVYKPISAELKCINVTYENRAIDKIVQVSNSNFGLLENRIYFKGLDEII